jgi:hypothetical protein
LQAQQPDFTPIPCQDYRKPLAAPLHSPKSDFQTQVLVQVKGWFGVITCHASSVQRGLKEQRIQVEQTYDSLVVMT